MVENIKLRKLKKYISHLEDIASYLVSKRIYLAGIDMINKFITEINITSPTGLMHLQQKDKNIFEKIAHQFIPLLHTIMMNNVKNLINKNYTYIG